MAVVIRVSLQENKLTVTVSKSTIVENVFKNFYDILNGNDSFTDIIFPAYPENFNIDSKGDYPVCILESPDISSEQFTMGKTVVDGTIEFMIHSTDAKTTDEYTSDAKEEIETNKYALSGVGLRMIFLTSTSKDTIIRGKIHIHVKTLTWSFKFYHTKTFAF